MRPVRSILQNPLLYAVIINLKIKIQNMRYTQKLEAGIVYYLKDFTAPKVFNGLYFECLLTDQKISAHCKANSTGIQLSNWDYEIYKPQRFGLKVTKCQHYLSIKQKGICDNCGAGLCYTLQFSRNLKIKM